MRYIGLDKMRKNSRACGSASSARVSFMDAATDVICYRTAKSVRMTFTSYHASLTRVASGWTARASGSVMAA